MRISVRYKKKNNGIKFMDKIKNAISEAWYGPGNATVFVKEYKKDHFAFMIYPSIREIVGGKQDGQTIFAGYIGNINKFAKVFDKTPRIYFKAEHVVAPHVLFIGKIRGYNVRVVLISMPPPDKEPTERVFTYGLKKGKVQSYFPKNKEK